MSDIPIDPREGGIYGVPSSLKIDPNTGLPAYRQVFTGYGRALAPIGAGAPIPWGGGNNNPTKDQYRFTPTYDGIFVPYGLAGTCYSIITGMVGFDWVLTDMTGTNEIDLYGFDGAPAGSVSTVVFGQGYLQHTIINHYMPAPWAPPVPLRFGLKAGILYKQEIFGVSVSGGFVTDTNCYLSTGLLEI